MKPPRKLSLGDELRLLLPDLPLKAPQADRDVVNTPDPTPKRPPINAAFADSLYAVTGRPAHMDYSPVPDAFNPFEPSLARAHYNAATDRVVMSKERGGNQDAVLAHELGHRLEAKGDPAARAAFDSAVAKAPLAQPALGEYARTDKTEQFAEAFSRAVQFLRHYSEPRVAEYGVNDLRQGDSQVPGTAAMVRYLLNTETFANHPNRETFGNVPDSQAADPGFVATPQADVSRVKPVDPYGNARQAPAGLFGEQTSSASRRMVLQRKAGP